MKTIFTLLLFPFFLGGQTLSRYEVYNFSEGDIFITTHAFGSQLSGTKTVYRFDTIARILLHDSTQIRYITKSSSFFQEPWFPQDMFSPLSYDRDTIEVKNLDQPLIHEPSWCTFISDTVYSSSYYCGKKVFEYNAGQAFPFCEVTSKYIEGCGGPYLQHTSTDTSNQVTYSSQHKLLFYQKDGVECGEYLVGLKDNDIYTEVSILPNPASEFLQFVHLPVSSTIQIFNVQGQLLKTIIYEGQNVDISGLELGIYLVVCRTPSGQNISSLFIKN